MMVTDVDLPAWSVEVTTMTLAPFARVMALLKDPLDSTVTAPWSWLFSWTVTVTGELVASLVVPVTVMDALLVISPSVGLVTFREGATVSTVKVVDFCSAALPSLSLASTVTVWLPSPMGEAGV